MTELCTCTQCDNMFAHLGRICNACGHFNRYPVMR
jgi:hypothetical protein